MTDTVTIQARKLTNGKAKFISLVDTPASQIPFKILKSDLNSTADEAPPQESTMFKNTLAKIMKGDDAQAAPAMVAVCIVDKGDLDREATKATLVEKGFDVVDVEDVDGIAIFKSDAYSEEDATALQINGDVTAVLTGVTKSFDPWSETSSFMENIGAGGFYPSVRMANEALMDTIYNVMRSADDAGEAAPDLATVLDDHKAYVLSLVNNIPEMAFKMDEFEVSVAVAKDDEADGDEPEADPDLGEGDASQDDPEADADAGAEGDAPEGEDPEGDDPEADPDAEDAPEGDEPEEIEKSDEVVPEWAKTILKSVEGLPAMTEKLDNLSESVGSLESRVDKSDEVAKKTELALKGTVISGSEDDPEAQEEVSKGDGDVYSGTSLDNIIPSS